MASNTQNSVNRTSSASHHASESVGLSQSARTRVDRQKQRKQRIQQLELGTAGQTNDLPRQTLPANQNHALQPIQTKAAKESKTHHEPVSIGSTATQRTRPGTASSTKGATTTGRLHCVTVRAKREEQHRRAKRHSGKSSRQHTFRPEPKRAGATPARCTTYR